MSKKILFLSKDNLTTNPRLKKELFTALELGFEVTFVGFKLNNWSDNTEKKYQNLPFKKIYLPATKKDGFILWFLASIIEKTSEILYNIFKNSLIINSFAHSKRSFLLWWYLFKDKNKYDFISAHTLPTLFPAYFFAKKNKIQFSFDIEDFYPEEKISGKNSLKEKKRRYFLMKKILPKASFFTYASPLIGEETLKLLENSQIPLHSFIANSFPQKYFEYTENFNTKIDFVWFSQNISANRGLEKFLIAAEKFKDKIHIHLIGNLYQSFYNNFLKKYKQFVSIYKPLEESELYKKICQFDIGLALEIAEADFNREICLTNKIYAYYQSGLFILATQTKGQKLFVSQNPKSGIICKYDIKEFEDKIRFIIENIDEIRKNKKQRFEQAKKISWDNEKQKIIRLWKKIWI